MLKSFQFLPITVPGCVDADLVGDGICDDETNVAVCNYDGGDCCLAYVNKDRCTKCRCHAREACALGNNPFTVGDGCCNIENNNKECLHDGLDCGMFWFVQTAKKRYTHLPLYDIK